MAKQGASRPDKSGAASEFRYPGNRLGMPEEGSGSVAAAPRRLVALAIDWALSLSVAHALFDADPTTMGYITLLIFAAQAMVLLAFTGTTIGKRIAGVRMASTGDRRLSWPFAVAVRTLLLCLVIPAVIYDRDNRGLHDRIAGTVSARF